LDLRFDSGFRNINEEKNAVVKAIDFYNHERSHMSIKMITPGEAVGYRCETGKKWQR
jgi:transposase InsO family protein